MNNRISLNKAINNSYKITSLYEMVENNCKQYDSKTIVLFMKKYNLTGRE